MKKKMPLVPDGSTEYIDKGTGKTATIWAKPLKDGAMITFRYDGETRFRKVTPSMFRQMFELKEEGKHEKEKT